MSVLVPVGGIGAIRGEETCESGDAGARGSGEMVCQGGEEGVEWVGGCGRFFVDGIRGEV